VQRFLRALSLMIRGSKLFQNHDDMDTVSIEKQNIKMSNKALHNYFSKARF